jgi:hypothetical protein
VLVELAPDAKAERRILPSFARTPTPPYWEVKMIDFQVAKKKYDCRAEIAKDLGAPISTGETWVWPCPFHGETTPGGFHVYQTGYHCFACESHGDVFDWRAYWHKQSLAEVLRGEGFDPVAMQERAVENAARLAKELELKIAEAQAALAELRSAKKWEQYNANLTEKARDLYRLRGIPDWYQDWIKLGFCDDFRVYWNNSEYHTQTLTIPVYATGWECVNIRHRLLTPPDGSPGNKYRPERSGLKTHLFLADPEKTPANDYTLVVEGEFKAAVTFVALDSPKWQVVGLPGKNIKQELADELSGSHIVVCLDPDAQMKDSGGKDSYQRLRDKLGRGFRAIYLPDKIDDLITAGALGQDELRGLINNARKIQ